VRGVGAGTDRSQATRRKAFVDPADPSTTIGCFIRRKAGEGNGRLLDEADELFTATHSRWAVSE
jgi:hypothetical protein